ncbi:ABC transporter permease [Roseovarius sp. TE539]|nr:ABC transporter permease [Roseovarius sp. TE539]
MVCSIRGSAMTEPAAPGRNRALLRRFTRHRGAVAGAAVFLAIVAAVWLGPFLWRVDPAAIDILARNRGPAPAHPLGTDQLGRDMLARLLAGGRISVAVGLAAMALSLGLGGLVGLLAGWVRWLDGGLMRLTDLFLSLPLLPLLLVMVMLFRESLAAAFGPQTGIFLLIVFAIGITSWMPTARLVRAAVLEIRERDFILAAHAAGTAHVAMVTRHILPNVMSPVLVSATLGIANAIVTESALSFLGLGFPPDFPTWGRLLSDATVYLQTHPGRVIWPGAAISLTVLAINYTGDGLRDALDTRHRMTGPSRI